MTSRMFGPIRRSLVSDICATTRKLENAAVELSFATTLDRQRRMVALIASLIDEMQHHLLEMEGHDTPRC